MCQKEGVHLKNLFPVAQVCFVWRSNAHRKEKTDSTLIRSSLHFKQSQLQIKHAQQNILYISCKKCHQIYSLVAEMKHVKAVQTT